MSMRMSRSTFWLLLNILLALAFTTAVHVRQASGTLVTALLAVSWGAIVIAGLVRGTLALHRRFRAPDVVITVTDRPAPLEAKFLEQDRRLERRERLKGELFALNGEIETFNANLTPDERKAWLHRPGPYGK